LIMTQLQEAAKGLSDFPIAVLSLVFGIISLYNKNKKWGFVFILVGFCAVVGGIAHTFVFSKFSLKLIWTVLYLLMFESVRGFVILLLDKIHKLKNITKYLLIFEFLLYFVTIYFLYGINGKDILVFVLFSAICLGSLVFAMVKYKCKNKSIIKMFVFLAVPVILQPFASAFPYLIVIEHISLFIVLFTVFKISKE